MLCRQMLCKARLDMLYAANNTLFGENKYKDTAFSRKSITLEEIIILTS